VPESPLIPRVGVAVATVALGLAVLFGLGVAVHGLDHGLAVDDAINRWVHAHFGVYARNDLVTTSDPPMMIGLFAMVAYVAVLRRRWDVLVLTVVSPLLATGLTEKVLKPLFDRSNLTVVQATGAQSYAYPSGHEAAVSTLLVIIGLAVLTAPLRLLTKSAWLVVLAAYYALSVLGLVGAYYHFASDTLGSLGLALAVVPGLALLLDRLHRRRVSSPGAPGPARTARAA
jgi:membrane-associated phospholipid phosphatase